MKYSGGTVACDSKTEVGKCFARALASIGIGISIDTHRYGFRYPFLKVSPIVSL